MFDNPEKLFLILVVALMIFGPSKLAGLGGTLGRAMRDFRSAVRGAQEEFGSHLHEAQEAMRDARETLTSSVQETYAAPEPAGVPALPSPDPVAPSLSSSAPTVVPAAPAAEATVETPETGGAERDDFEGPHSLASEPSARAVHESTRR